MCAKNTRSIWIAAVALALLVAVAFANSVGGAFVFDDEPTILKNPSIRDLGNLRAVLSPPAYTTTVGRPLANATLALNRAISGSAPWSYHVVNILIHMGAALALFGVVRRVLSLPVWNGRFVRDGVWLAFALAALWAVHPLQTESVTYLVQRVESLAGLCYLLTVYCFLRSAESRTAWRWQLGSVFACMVGAGCKETIVSAPLLILLVDGTWLAGTYCEAWRRRKWLYFGLGGTWILLAFLVSGAANRGGTAGLGTASSWQYLLTQCGAIMHYLRLVVWPAPLVFDYGNALSGGLSDVWWQGLLLCALAMGVMVAIWRKSWLGVAGFWFFSILAPSSSVVPVLTQTVAEHRMYLPLAAVLAIFVFTLYRWFGPRAFYLLAAAFLVWSGLTVRRNMDYRSGISIWADTVEKMSENWRARNNLALALAEAGRVSEAVPQYEVILGMRAGLVEVRNNYANALVLAGRAAEALREIDTALAVAPQVAELIDTRGVALAALGRKTEAEACFREALRLKPGLEDAEQHLHKLNGTP